MHTALKTLLHSLLAMASLAMLSITPAAHAQHYRSNGRHNGHTGERIALSLGSAVVGALVADTLTQRNRNTYQPVPVYNSRSPTIYRAPVTDTYRPTYIQPQPLRTYSSGYTYNRSATSGISHQLYLAIANDCAHQVKGACEAIDYFDRLQR